MSRKRRGVARPPDRYWPVRSRWPHPGQQQGRRWPSSSSSWVRRMRRSRVIFCLASTTQQMNSLRAKGVMSFQASSAAGLATSALRRSSGSSWTTPPGTRWLLTRPRYRFARRIRRVLTASESVYPTCSRSAPSRPPRRRSTRRPPHPVRIVGPRGPSQRTASPAPGRIPPPWRYRSWRCPCTGPPWS
jgi:hypothetical protein